MVVGKRLPFWAKLSIAFFAQFPALIIAESRELCGSAIGDDADGFPALTTGVVAALAVFVLGRLPDCLHSGRVLPVRIRYWGLWALVAGMLLGLLFMFLMEPGFPSTYVFYLSWGSAAGLWLSESTSEAGVGPTSAG